MLVSPSFLSEEEKKFVKESMSYGSNVAKYYNGICEFMQSVELAIEVEGKTKHDEDYHLFNLVVFMYLMPLIGQLYESILDLLKKEQILAASCLFRTLVEAYIDVSVILKDPSLAQRYYDYGSIATANVHIAECKTYKFPNDISANIFQEQSNYRRKYKIQSDKELRTWSGISVRQMVKLLAVSDNEWWNGMYAFYSNSSNCAHPSSSCMACFKEFQKIEEIRENVFSKNFVDVFFFGGFILYMTCCEINRNNRIEGSKQYDVLLRKMQTARDALEGKRKECYEWQESIYSFHLDKDK
jgi:hypothetical protein